MSVAFQTKSPLLVKLCSHCTEQTFKRGIQTVVNLRIWHLFSGILFSSTCLCENQYVFIYQFKYSFIYSYASYQLPDIAQFEINLL